MNDGNRIGVFHVALDRKIKAANRGKFVAVIDRGVADSVAHKAV